MFKFIKQYAEKMNDAAIYPLISLFIFFVFFIVLIIMVKRMKKENLTALSNLPFEKDEQNNSTL